MARIRNAAHARKTRSARLATDGGLGMTREILKARGFAVQLLDGLEDFTNFSLDSHSSSSHILGKSFFSPVKKVSNENPWEATFE